MEFVRGYMVCYHLTRIKIPPTPLAAKGGNGLMANATDSG